MPTQLEITNGPPFKKLLFMSVLADDHGWLLSFEFKGNDHPAKESLMILGLARRQGDGDDDLYGFIGHRQQVSKPWNHLFYVGTYNTRTRQGKCEVYDRAEFARCPLAKAMFERV